MLQFDKILNSTIDSFLQRGQYQECGYTIRLQADLSNPRFETCRGGLQAKITRRYPDCGHVNTRIQANLYEYGTLKIVRSSYGKDKFTCDYFLFPSPLPQIPAKQYLKCREIQPFYAKVKRLMYPDLSRCKEAEDKWGAVECVHAREPYAALGDTYTAISRTVITDKRLRHAALCLYAVIKRLQDQNQRGTGDWQITKSGIYSYFRPHCGRDRFNTMWTALKNCGYLLVYKTHRKGKITYGYKLYDEPVEPVSDKVIYLTEPDIQEGRKKPENAEKDRNIVSPTSPLPHSQKGRKRPKKADYEAIKERIDYEWLIDSSVQLSVFRQSGLVYRKEDIDACMRLMVDTLANGKPVKVDGEYIPAQEVRERLESLTAAHILHVLHRTAAQAENGGVKNPKAYKLACLLNAVYLTADELAEASGA